MQKQKQLRSGWHDLSWMIICCPQLSTLSKIFSQKGVKITFKLALQHSMSFWHETSWITQFNLSSCLKLKFFYSCILSLTLIQSHCQWLQWPKVFLSSPEVTASTSFAARTNHVQTPKLFHANIHGLPQITLNSTSCCWLTLHWVNRGGFSFLAQIQGKET